MQIINIHEAKTHLSRLIEKVVQGEPFIIAKAGKPLVKVIAIASATRKKKSRVGFMKGEIMVPKDFDTMGGQEIENIFGGKE